MYFLEEGLIIVSFNPDTELDLHHDQRDPNLEADSQVLASLPHCSNELGRDFEAHLECRRTQRLSEFISSVSMTSAMTYL